MTCTKIAVVGFLALLGFVCWLAAAGFGAAREGLISLVALALLVGGGNLLSGRASPYGRRGAPRPPGPSPCEPAGDLDVPCTDEPAP